MMEMKDRLINVVIDTNVIVSAALSRRGNPATIFEMLLDGEIQNFTSDDILEEVKEVLSRPKITKNILVSDAQAIFYKFKQSSIIVKISESINKIRADPDDDKFLECALAADANYIISGDDHLLQLKQFRAIKIVSPAEFIQIRGT